jgi:hypothetical protein
MYAKLAKAVCIPKQEAFTPSNAPVDVDKPLDSQQRCLMLIVLE